MKLKQYHQWYDTIRFIMKITAVHLMISTLLSSVVLASPTSGQGLLDKQITLNAEQVELRQLLDEVEKIATVKFAYSPRMIRVRQVVSVKAEQEKLGEVLTKLLSPLELSYKLIEGRILIFKNPPTVETRALLDLPLESNLLQVSGVVKDENGSPIPGVNIIEKGTTNGTTSNASGAYTIAVEGEASILVFSFIGYTAEEVSVGGRTVINVSLTPDILALQEVIVIGYGEKSRKLMTESVGTVSAQEITRLPVTSADQALQGRISGVQVTSVDGTPGAPVAIRIRGVGTVGNTQPLFVVDGVPVGNNSNEITNPLSTINPADIESITVLKDASAAAVYGVRAANGVVLITTKRGKTGKPTIGLDSYYGVQQIRRFNEYNSTDEWLRLTQEAFDNANAQNNLAPGNPSFRVLHPDLAPGSPLRERSNERAWRDAALNTPAPIQNHNVSISGGGDNYNFFVSGGYFKQEATVRNWDLDRYTFRANADFKVNKRVRVGQTFTVSYQEVKRGMNGGGDGILLKSAMTMPPFFSIYEDPNNPIPGNRYGYDGNLNRAGLTISNQVGINEIMYHTDRQTRMLGSVYGEVDIVSGLTFRSVASIDFSTTQNDRWRPEYLAPEMGLNRPLNEYVDERGHNAGKVFTNTLNYKKQFGDHSLDLLAGLEYQGGGGSSLGVENSDFIGTSPDFYRVVGRGRAEKPAITGGAGQGAFVGYLGRLSYNFQEKYLLTATVRRDGTSNFSPVDNRRWGTFPSFSAAWRISEERFFNTGGLINELKLRAGWGQLGNSNTASFPHIFRLSPNPDYALGGSNTIQAPVPINFVNQDVKWETVETVDIGFDMSMFNNKINVLAAFYDRTTKDFLYLYPLPRLTGFENTPVNLGSVNNRGIELEIGYSNTFNNGLTMQLSGNITTVRNRLVELAPGLEQYTANNIYRTAVGKPIGYFFGYKTDGLWQTQEEIDAVFTDGFKDVSSPQGPRPGDVRFLDVNGPGEGTRFSGEPDGLIDPNDRTYIGKTIPSYYYGLSANFMFKNFDLNLLFQGVGDVQVYNEVRRDGLRLTGGGGNVLVETQERWTGPGTSNSIPRAIADDYNSNNRFSDRFVENAGFLRLRNIQLGYNLAQSLRDRIGGFRSARIYVAGTNLLTFTNYSGMDPEVMTYRSNSNQTEAGTDRGNMPQPRIYQLGIQLSF